MQILYTSHQSTTTQQVYLHLTFHSVDRDTKVHQDNCHAPTEDDEEDADHGQIQPPLRNNHFFSPLELLPVPHVRIAICPSFDDGAPVPLGFERTLSLDYSTSWIREVGCDTACTGEGDEEWIVVFYPLFDLPDGVGQYTD